MRSVVKTTISSFIVFVALIAGACSGHADQTLKVGRGVVCDTAEEVKAVIDPSSEDVSTRLIVVNGHYGKEACNVITVAYVRGDEESTMLVSVGIIHVVKVQVVGFKAGSSWMRMEKPLDQYAAFLESALSA